MSDIKDSDSTNSEVFVVELTRDEMEELKLALAARSRANGPNTQNFRLCRQVLTKIRESEESRRINPDLRIGSPGESSKL